MEEDANGETQLPGGDNPQAAPEAEEPPPQPTSPTMSEEPPRPVGPTLNKSQIVAESLDIIRTHRDIINDQKHFLANMGFMTFSTMRLLDAGRELHRRLDGFLVHDARLQDLWYRRYHELLPSYGDYDQVLADSGDQEVVDEVASPQPQAALKDLVQEVVEMMYACGMNTRVVRLMDSAINAHMDNLRTATDQDSFPFYTWLEMLTMELGNEEALERQFFEVSSFMDFMNYSVSDTDIATFSKTI